MHACRAAVVEIGAAFDEHQRRTVGGRALLGPDAAAHAVERFRALGAEVVTSPSPWRLDAATRALTVAWLDGWVGAAVEQRPGLSTDAAAYTARRTAELEDGLPHEKWKLSISAWGSRGRGRMVTSSKS